jgi:hypothetical protein
MPHRYSKGPVLDFLAIMQGEIWWSSVYLRIALDWSGNWTCMVCTVVGDHYIYPHEPDEKVQQHCQVSQASPKGIVSIPVWLSAILGYAVVDMHLTCPIKEGRMYRILSTFASHQGRSRYHKKPFVCLCVSHKVEFACFQTLRDPRCRELRGSVSHRARISTSCAVHISMRKDWSSLGVALSGDEPSVKNLVLLRGEGVSWRPERGWGGGGYCLHLRAVLLNICEVACWPGPT